MKRLSLLFFFISTSLMNTVFSGAKRPRDLIQEVQKELGDLMNQYKGIPFTVAQNDQKKSIALSIAEKLEALGEVERAVKWYKDAVLLGSQDAAQALVYIYQEGIDGFPDELRAQLFLIAVQLLKAVQDGIMVQGILNTELPIIISALDSDAIDIDKLSTRLSRIATDVQRLKAEKAKVFAAKFVPIVKNLQRLLLKNVVTISAVTFDD